MSETIRWLHLTDLHVGVTDQDWLWPRMQGKFRDDLKKIHDRAGPWDLVLFTGDLVQKGTEYGRLGEILGEIWTWFRELGCDPKLLAVPGNHDLQWQDPEQAAVDALENWSSKEWVRRKFWTESEGEYRQVVNTAFAAYDTWWKGTPLKPDHIVDGMLPGDFSYTHKKNGFSLGIVGLNSAFLQLTDREESYQGHLIADPRQFHAVCGGNGVDWAESHHACVLMTHHPPEWLDKGSQRQLSGEIMESFCLHLCGHNHLTEVQQILSGGTADAPLLWLGRSIFGLERCDKGKLNRSHGYVTGELRVQNGCACLQFMPRRRESQGNHWNLVPDPSVELPVDNERTREFHVTVHSSLPLPPPPTGEVFVLFPRCIRRALALAYDPSLKELMAKLEGGLENGLRDRGVMPVLRDISGILDSLTGRPAKLSDLLACLAPLAVPAESVEEWRKALGLDPSQEPERFRAGVVHIGSKTRREADAIIRSALFDRPCLWEVGSLAGDHDCHLFGEVPPPGPTEKDRLDSLEKRLLATCRAGNLAGAMDTMYEWLYDGAPLTITCKLEFEKLLAKLAPGFHALPDGTRVNLRELLLLLVQTDAPERVAVDGLITRLNTIFEKYSRM